MLDLNNKKENQKEDARKNKKRSKNTGIFTSHLILPIKLFLPLALCSCATTHKGKYVEAMLIGSSLGAVYGATRSEFRNQNALLFSSMCGIAGAVTAAVMDDSDKKIKDLEYQVKFFDETTSHKEKSQLEEIPEEFRALLESQTYEMYQINRWTRKGEKYLVKESELIELTGKR